MKNLMQTPMEIFRLGAIVLVVSILVKIYLPTAIPNFVVGMFFGIGTALVIYSLYMWYGMWKKKREDEAKDGKEK